MAEVSFGEWLKRQRKAAGLTQEQLALQISCSTSALKKIEAEDRRPSAQITEQLAEIFHIPQHERTAFLRFARGDWQAAPTGVENAPWHFPHVSETNERSKSKIVTFLFTDIEGSLKLSQQYPEAISSLLARHHEILNHSFQAHDGHIFQIIGDGFCAAFHSPGNALNAALEIQEYLQNEPWSPAPVQVRMGIHTGEAQLNSDSAQNPYMGYTTLALTQRIMSASHGGQILLTNATETLLRGELPKDVSLRDMGEHKFKDVFQPVRVFQVIAPNLQKEFPALRALDVFPNNLPIQLTSFVGRRKQIGQIKKLMERYRLVTLTGSGGIGKTRLSIQVASELLNDYTDGAWLVELAPITDPLLVTQTVCAALDVTLQGDTPALNVLMDYLKPKKVLVVVDNCEHLIDACAQMTDTILRACPNLQIIATSREALGIEGESAYRVPSLSLADPNGTLNLIEQSEAVSLFVERANAALPGYVITEANAPIIAQICQRLDGIALAIELAASRVKLLKVDQIAKRLDDTFRLLTGGSRTALPRQQTLRGAIDWSYNLLTDEERRMLRWLSVFAGGWTLETAEAVCENENTLDLLVHLVDKSLVGVDREHGNEARYYLLETIRQYAREKLVESGESNTLRDRHLAYFANLAERAKPELYRSNQVFWLNKLEDELDNLRMAMEWAINTNVESGLRLIVTPPFFGEAPGDILEVEGWLAQLLEGYKKVDSLRVQMLVIYGRLRAERGDLSEAHKIANQSLEISRAISDKQAEALSLWFLGAVISTQGNYKESIPVMEKSLVLFQSLGDKLGQAMTTGMLSQNLNDLKSSKVLVSEALKLYRELGHLLGIADCLRELALRMIWEGNFSSSVPLLEEAHMIYRQLRNKSREAEVLQSYGTLAYWKGDYQKAYAFYKESFELNESVGNYYLASWAGVNMAYALLWQGDISKAKELFELWVQRYKSKDIDLVIYALEGLASLNVKQGQPERAARLFAWTNAMRDNLGDYNPPVEQASIKRDLAVIRSQLNEATFENAYNAGRSLAVEQAIDLALETNVDVNEV